jgi:hypothetical protein
MGWVKIFGSMLWEGHIFLNLDYIRLHLYIANVVTKTVMVYIS